MGAAIVLQGAFATNATAFASSTISPGDSFNIKNFYSPDYANLEFLIRGSTTGGGMRVLSPLLHDNVTGLTFYDSENPAVRTVPWAGAQPVQPGDLLTVNLQGGSAETTVGAWSVYYSNLPGANARLHSPGDIVGNVQNLKLMEVDVTSSGTIGTWVDTLCTVTEDQLKANKDYAILGYLTNPSLTVVAVKGDMTSNFRIGGPGTSTSIATDSFFVDASNMFGTPHIPVFNANDATNTYVSCLANTTSVSAKVTLVLAQLKNTLTP